MEWYQAVNLETEGRRCLCFLVCVGSHSGICSGLFHLAQVPIPCDVCMPGGLKMMLVVVVGKGQTACPTYWMAQQTINKLEHFFYRLGCAVAHFYFVNSLHS